jgi:hypothetical protein
VALAISRASGLATVVGGHFAAEDVPELACHGSFIPKNHPIPQKKQKKKKNLNGMVPMWEIPD